MFGTFAQRIGSFRAPYKLRPLCLVSVRLYLTPLRIGIHLNNGLQGELACDERGSVQSVQFHDPELGMGTHFVKTYDDQGPWLGLHLMSPEGQEVPLDEVRMIDG